jgi:MFS family permease
MTKSASPARGGTASGIANPAPPGRLTHRQILTVLSGLLLGMFLAALDQTIVSTSIRTITDDLNGLSHQAWVTTAYLITSTISTTLYGKLSDIYGRKPFFLAAISIFIVGSAACSFATSMIELACLRAFRGLGAGGLMSLALAIIGDMVPPRERARYKIFPVIGSTLMVAAMLLLHYRVQWNSPLPETMSYMALFGAGIGGCFQVLTLAMQNAVEPRDMGVATASATFFRQMGSTAGTAIFLSVLFSTLSTKISSAFKTAYDTARFQQAIHDPAVLSNPANAPVLTMLRHPQSISGSGAGVLDDSSFIQHLNPQLAQPFKAGFTDSMHIVFLLGAAVMVLAFLVAAWTKEVPLRKVSGLEARAAAERGAAAPDAGAAP